MWMRMLKSTWSELLAKLFTKLHGKDFLRKLDCHEKILALQKDAWEVSELRKFAIGKVLQGSED